eukprot:3861660-Rhodomonas_salina.3
MLLPGTRSALPIAEGASESGVASPLSPYALPTASPKLTYRMRCYQAADQPTIGMALGCDPGTKKIPRALSARYCMSGTDTL